MRRSGFDVVREFKALGFDCGFSELSNIYGVKRPSWISDLEWELCSSDDPSVDGYVNVHGVKIFRSAQSFRRWCKKYGPPF